MNLISLQLIYLCCFYILFLLSCTYFAVQTVRQSTHALNVILFILPHKYIFVETVSYNDFIFSLCLYIYLSISL